MTSKNVLVLDNVDAMAEFMALRFLELYQGALSQRGKFIIALSGGNAPVKFYQRLAKCDKINWHNVHVFLVDERFVALDHDDNNYHLLCVNLFDVVNFPQINRHFVPIADSVVESARRYEKQIYNFFNLSSGTWPQFDLIMLGVGADGHTASLFPKSAELLEEQHAVVAVEIPHAHYQRITLTLPVINHARHVIFYVSGALKKEIMRRVIQDADPALPASHVIPHSGSLSFVLDSEVAKSTRSEAKP